MWQSFKNVKLWLFPIFCLVIILTGCNLSDSQPPAKKFPVLTGAYLGQTPPGAEPELFASGIVTTGLFTRDIAMTPDGKEIYFCVSVGNYTYSTIICTKLENGRWTKPEVAPFAADPRDTNIEPFISTDGQKFYFLSDRPDIAAGDTIKGDQDIWVMDRTENGWSEPYNLGAPINSDGSEFFPSLTNDGTIYFTRAKKGERPNFIYRSRLVDGKYTDPEKLPAQVNSGPTQFNAYISPDESYLIVCVFGRKDSYGATDYYVCFRNEDDTWNEPINMGDKINTDGGREYSPYVSPDGKYFFFMSSRTKPLIGSQEENLTFDKLQKMHNQPENGNPGIYWIDAAFIEKLKPE